MICQSGGPFCQFHRWHSGDCVSSAHAHWKDQLHHTEQGAGSKCQVADNVDRCWLKFQLFMKVKCLVLVVVRDFACSYSKKMTSVCHWLHSGEWELIPIPIMPHHLPSQSSQYHHICSMNHSWFYRVPRVGSPKPVFYTINWGYTTQSGWLFQGEFQWCSCFKFRSYDRNAGYDAWDGASAGHRRDGHGTTGHFIDKSCPADLPWHSGSGGSIDLMI